MSVKNWDLYFLKLAKEVSKNSKCLSRKIGAILVKDKAIISTGYNGPARGMKHCGERGLDFYTKLSPILWLKNPNESCPRKVFNFKSGDGLFLCQAGHAERNALIQAVRNGISTLGTTLYCACPIPCKDCMIEIINAGVKRLVYLKGKNYDDYSKILLEESDITSIAYEKII